MVILKPFCDLTWCHKPASYFQGVFPAIFVYSCGTGTLECPLCPLYPGGCTLSYQASRIVGRLQPRWLIDRLHIISLYLHNIPIYLHNIPCTCPSLHQDPLVWKATEQHLCFWLSQASLTCWENFQSPIWSSSKALSFSGDWLYKHPLALGRISAGDIPLHPT